MRFDPTKFGCPGRDEPASLWGGGHTSETDPIAQGWRCRRVRDDLWLMGQRGEEGCASFRIVDGQWDVAVYDRAPHEVHHALVEGSPLGDGPYHQIPDVPGFGLRVIQFIRENR